MSSQIFPTLAGLGWDVERTPMWQNTRQKAFSGAETAVAYWSYPKWKYALTYNVLREGVFGMPATTYQEFSQLCGFFNQLYGNFDSFLFTDPQSNSVTGQTIGTGDGVETEFQCVRAFGNFVEPVFAPNPSGFLLYLTNWQGQQLQYTTARTNLLSYSQDLTDASWTKTRASATGNTISAPDGTSTADTLTEDATAGNTHIVTRNVGVNSGQNYTYSVYMKAGVRTAARLRWDLGAQATQYADFDLSGGTIFASSGVVSSSITSMGSGWYRCTIVCASTDTTARLSIMMENPVGTTSYNGTGTATMYIWGQQLESGSTLTSYIATTTSTVTVTDYSLQVWGDTWPGLITFAVPPTTGATVSGSFSFWIPCRFDVSELTFKEFLKNLFSTDGVQFSSIKLGA